MNGTAPHTGDEHLHGAFLKKPLAHDLSFDDDILPYPNRRLASGLPVLCEMIRIDAITPEGIREMYDAGADLTLPDNHGNTPLVYAVREGRHDLFLALIHHLGTGTINDIVKNGPARENHTTLLHIAAANGFPDIVSDLIDMGANVNAVTAQGSALCFAVRNLEEDCVRILLNSGADSRTLEDETGISFLELLQKGMKDANDANAHAAILRQLIDANVFLDGHDENTPPLLVCFVMRGQTLYAKWMLDAGADPNIGDRSINHNRALTHAIYSEDVSMTEALLKAGANPNHSGPRETLPLVQAGVRELWPIVDLLFAHGANVNSISKTGMTVLTSALSQGAPVAVIEHFLNKGADPNEMCQKLKYSTPLHLAAKKGDIDCINVLLRFGANPLLLSRTGETPLEAAKALWGENNIVTARLQLATDAARVKFQQSRKGPAP